KVALIISVVLQFAAAIIALSLVRRTRTNIAWWLISGGFLLMAFRRFFELLQVYDSHSRLITGMLSSWIGVLISVVILLSLIFIKRIFNIQKQMDDLRKQNEARVLSAIIKTEEKERQHFATELHDGLGTLLSSVKMTISAIGPDGDKSGKFTANAGKLIDESIASLREISNKLSPHVLNNFGLLKAVKSFIKNLAVIDAPAFHLNSDLNGKRFSYNIEVVLYRIVCELISNSLKYAHAKNIYIDLFSDEKAISLHYIDDGIGFDTDLLEKEHKGMGYSNISSRVRSLNGTFDIFSVPGEGINATVQINLV
ncbi:MAG: sensor histidine kinase, partial [Bacteroidales bacterium]|nr:sensor histidine kinase [Bacteroidales bacterium]